MNENFLQLLGWTFAAIYLGATLFRLVTILFRSRPTDVSIVYWALMGVAHFCLYLFIGGLSGKWGMPQVLIGLLGTSVLNFIIVGNTLSQRKTLKREGRKIEAPVEIVNTPVVDETPEA